MAINFPLNPTLNEIYSYNGLSWQWNGSYWQSFPPSSGATGVVTSIIASTGLSANTNTGDVTLIVTGSTGGGTFNGGTVTGATSFTGGLTSNSISATTYQNLPVSGITSGRGISASTSTGNVTISSFQNNIINVGKSGTVDYNSIKSAVDSITTSSVTNRYVIQVGPGIYSENPIDLTSKPYISIVGSDIFQVIAVPTSGNEGSILFKLGNANEMSFMTISGMTGGTGIGCFNTNGFSLVHKISMYDNNILMMFSNYLI
jgi:pectin methylesterase-like acyl-CoA thioesterase